MANRWSEETTLKFVQLYREHENLWNMFIPEYRNRDARSSSMEAIASELNLTIKEVPKKLRLRSTYYLELAKIEKSKASGSGTNLVHKPLLPWFDDIHLYCPPNTNNKIKQALLQPIGRKLLFI